MLTKEIIAKDKNYTAERMHRTLLTNYDLDLKEGDIYDNLGNAESWAEPGAEFTPENDWNSSGIMYVLKVEEPVNVHKVDYTNEEEINALSADDCEKENELLVTADTKFRVIWGQQDVDLEEMGYYTVELELVKENE